VSVDGQQYTSFDADKLTVKVPDSKEPVQIKVRIVPKAQGV
jgi:hypothetical protein